MIKDYVTKKATCCYNCEKYIQHYAKYAPDAWKGKEIYFELCEGHCTSGGKKKTRKPTDSCEQFARGTWERRVERLMKG